MPKAKSESSGPSVKVSSVPSAVSEHFEENNVDSGLTEFVQAVAKNEPNTDEIIKIAILLAQRNPSPAILKKIRDLIPSGEALPPAKSEDERGESRTVAGIIATPIERANREGYKLELHNPGEKKVTVDVAFDESRNLELTSSQDPPVKHGTPSAKYTIPSDARISRSTTVIHAALPPGSKHYVTLEPLQKDEPQHLEFVVTETAQVIERKLASGLVLRQTNHPQASGYSISAANTSEKNFECALDFSPSVNLAFSSDTPADTTTDTKTKKATFFAPAGMKDTTVVTLKIDTLDEDIALKMKVGLKEKKEKPKPKPKPEPEPSDDESEDSLPPMARMDLAKKLKEEAEKAKSAKLEPPKPKGEEEDKKAARLAAAMAKVQEEEQGTAEGQGLESGSRMRKQTVDESESDGDGEVMVSNSKEVVPDSNDVWGQKQELCRALVQTQELGTKDGWKLHLENPTDDTLQLDVDFSGCDNLKVPRNQMEYVAVEDFAKVLTTSENAPKRKSGYQTSVTLKPGDKRHVRLDAITPGEAQHLSYVISDSASVTSSKLSSGVVLHQCAFPQGGGFGLALENPSDCDVTITLNFGKSENLKLDDKIPDGTELLEDGESAKRRVNSKKGPEMFATMVPIEHGEPVKLVYSARQSVHKGKAGGVKGPKFGGDAEVVGPTTKVGKLSVTPVLLADGEGYKLRLKNDTEAPVSVDCDFGKCKGLSVKSDGSAIIRARPNTADLATPLAAVATVPPGETKELTMNVAKRSGGGDISFEVEISDTAAPQVRELDSGGVLHTAPLPQGGGFVIGVVNNADEDLKLVFDFTKCVNVLLHRSPGTTATVDIETMEGVIELPPNSPLSAFVTLVAQEAGKSKLAYALKQYVNGKPFRKK